MSRWTAREPDPASLARLSEGLNLRPEIASILALRGISGPREAQQFLSPSFADMFDPFLMKGMDAAVEVLVAAARAGERIVVFGDYDVDGVTATAQLRALFRALGAEAVPFLPHRVRDGYGLKPETFRKVNAEHRPRAIVTVDCGITAVEAVAEAARAGVSVVITDHHLPAERLPDGASVVNPKQPGCGYPFKELSGAGIAFKIAQAVIAREKLSLSARSLARVAALGTVADIVPLVSENRALVSVGLAALGDPRGEGLKALLAEAGVRGRPPRCDEVAFRIAPRLNAAGRLDTADLALALLEERDEARARELAADLSRRNSERQVLERRVVVEATAALEERGNPDEEGVLICASPDWPRGVLGIAASRLMRSYHRPALLFALDGERAVGSGRSIPGFSMHAVLTELSEFFLEFGGHAQACGATIAAGRFPEFERAARQLFRERLSAADREETVAFDFELPFSRVDAGLRDALEQLAPFGAGNPRPLFLARNVATEGALREVGGRGRKGRLSSGGASVDAIAWESAGDWSSAAGPADVLYHLSRSDGWNRVEVEIAAMRPAAG